MRAATADSVRGTVTAAVVGVWAILTPASALPHEFGYYVAVAAFLLGLRFGLRALGMFFVCCVAIGIAEAVGTGGCAAGSNNFRCAFEAAAPLLIFGYFVGPTLAGALLNGAVRLSRRRGFDPRRGGTLVLGHTVVVALAAAVIAFVAFALVPLHGSSSFLPGLAACLAFGLSPSYDADVQPVPAPRADAPTW